MSGIGRFKLSDALGKDAAASKAGKGREKEKGAAKITAEEASLRGHVAESGRGVQPTGHLKTGGGRGK